MAQSSYGLAAGLLDSIGAGIDTNRETRRQDEVARQEQARRLEQIQTTAEAQSRANQETMKYQRELDRPEIERERKRETLNNIREHMSRTGNLPIGWTTNDYLMLQSEVEGTKAPDLSPPVKAAGAAVGSQTANVLTDVLRGLPISDIVQQAVGEAGGTQAPQQPTAQDMGAAPSMGLLEQGTPVDMTPGAGQMPTTQVAPRATSESVATEIERRDPNFALPIAPGQERPAEAVPGYSTTGALPEFAPGVKEAQLSGTATTPGYTQGYTPGGGAPQAPSISPILGFDVSGLNEAQVMALENRHLGAERILDQIEAVDAQFETYKYPEMMNIEDRNRILKERHALDEKYYEQMQSILDDNVTYLRKNGNDERADIAQEISIMSKQLRAAEIDIDHAELIYKKEERDRKILEAEDKKTMIAMNSMNNAINRALDSADKTWNAEIKSAGSAKPTTGLHAQYGTRAEMRRDIAKREAIRWGQRIYQGYGLKNRLPSPAADMAASWSLNGISRKDWIDYRVKYYENTPSMAGEYWAMGQKKLQKMGKKPRAKVKKMSPEPTKTEKKRPGATSDW